MKIFILGISFGLPKHLLITPSKATNLQAQQTVKFVCKIGIQFALESRTQNIKLSKLRVVLKSIAV